MRSLVLLFLLACTMISCNKEIEKPEDLIPEPEMKSLLEDIYIHRQIKNIDVRKVESPAEMDLAILEKHNIDLERFKSSYKYYLIDGASYDKMLNEIKLNIEAGLPKDTIAKEKKEIGISKEIIKKGASNKKPTPSKE